MENWPERTEKAAGIPRKIQQTMLSIQEQRVNPVSSSRQIYVIGFH
jgi:hypothetical protein